MTHNRDGVESAFFPGLGAQCRRYWRSTVAKNAASLYLIHFANYLLPLITVPYVVRVLTPHGYGLVAFGTSLIGFFLVVIDYGFALSATRRISVQRDDPEAVNHTVFTVWAAKFLLCLAGFVILVVLVSLVPTLGEVKGLLFIIYGLALGNVLFPTWLYQGLERMVPISVINLIVRIMVVVGIFTLIKSPEDYLWYAGLNSFASLAAGVVGVVAAFHLFSLRPVWPSWRQVVQVLHEGRMLFFSRAGIGLYSVANPFILGMLTTPTVVGYYSAAEKIVFAFNSLLGPLADAVFPRSSNLASDSPQARLLWTRRLFFIMGSLGLSLTLFTFFLAPFLVGIFLGEKFTASVTVIRILSPLIIINGLKTVYGVNLMIPLHLDKEFLLIFLGGGLINIILAMFTVPVFYEIGMAISLLISNIFIIILIITLLFYKQLLFINCKSFYYCK
jgi:polysaccharide transporter, PST family